MWIADFGLRIEPPESAEEFDFALRYMECASLLAPSKAVARLPQSNKYCRTRAKKTSGKIYE